MNKTPRNRGSNFKYLESIEGNLDFQPIYDLGRHLSKSYAKNTASKTPLIRPIEEIDCPSELRAGLKKFFYKLSEDILFTQLNFPTVVLDFVLFDPADHEGRRYYIGICSNSKEILEGYKKQVEINVKGDIGLNESDEYKKRGPILTNDKIYHSPYFYRSTKNNFKKRFTRIDESHMHIQFGSFKAEKPNLVEIDKQAEHIEEFFDLISKVLNPIESEPQKDEFIFNTSMLIPLLRPAASFRGDDYFKLRGGGLFIYGNTNSETTPKTNQHPEIAAKLQHFFYKQILLASHTQIEIDFLRHNASNDMIHTIAEFMSTHVTGEIDYIMDNKIPFNEQKETLAKVKNSIIEFVEESRKMLNAYREYISIGSNIHYATGKDIYDISKDLADKHSSNIKINIDMPEALKQELISANKYIIKKILLGFINNSIKEFDRQSVSPKSILISASLGERDIIYFKYLNYGLKMSQNNMRKFGVEPFVTEHSSGMGGWFINENLRWMYAEELVSGSKRYVKAELTKEGVQFVFAFKLLKS